MTTPPLIPRALRVANYYRWTRYFGSGLVEMAVDSFFEDPMHQPMEDPHGNTWGLVGVIAKAWMEMPGNSTTMESTDRVKALILTASKDPHWAKGESLTWALTSLGQPMHETHPDFLEHFGAWDQIVRQALKSNPKAEREAIGTKALGVLNEQWAKLGNVDMNEAMRQRWIRACFDWVNPDAPHPLQDLPQWPQWAMDRTVEIMATANPHGIRAEDVELLLTLPGKVGQASQEWVQAWNKGGQDLLGLFELFAALPHQSSGDRDARYFWLGGAGVFLDMAHQWGQRMQEDLGEAHQQAFEKVADLVDRLEVGNIPFTERSNLKGMFLLLQSRLSAEKQAQALTSTLPAASMAAPRLGRL